MLRPLPLAAALLAAVFFSVSVVTLLRADESEPGKEPGKEPVEVPPAEEPAAEPQIRKEVLASGEGEPCGAGRAAVVHYTGTLTDRKQFDSSRDRKAPFTFVVGAGAVIAGWDEAVAQMRVGDRWKVTIPWQKAYGASGRPPTIPAAADLVFDIELLDVVEPKPEIVKSGKGEVLASGTRLEALLRLAVVGGTTLKDSWKEDSSEQIMTGRPSGIVGLDMMVARMRIGDRWSARLPATLAFGAAGRPPRIPPNAEVDCEVELVRVIEPTIEVLKEGEGARPEPQQLAVVHYTGTLLDGTKFDSSRDRGIPFRFVLGVGQVIEGWDATVARMRVGERVRVTIPWQMGYGARGSPPKIPARADLVFDIELLALE